MRDVWDVRIDVRTTAEGGAGATTCAHAFLVVRDRTRMSGTGRAAGRAEAADAAVATGRALRELADRLLDAVSEDLSEIGRQDVRLTS